MKTNPGRFFEDYRIGEVIIHAVPRTVSGGERAMYHAMYPARGALYSSDEFARASGLPAAPMDDLVAFHVVFGKTVPDISLNAVANLGYAEGRWLQPVWPGDTLRSESTVIGLKENSNGKSGNVYVRTKGINQHGQVVLEYVRWVMVRKNRMDAPAPEPVVPDLQKVVLAADLVIPKGLDFTAYDFSLAGEPHRWGDYAVGEKIDHVDGVTVEEASVGGLGAHVLTLASDAGLMDAGLKIRTMRLPDMFQEHDSPQKQYDEAGLNAPQIVETVLKALRHNSAGVEEASASA